MTRGKVEVISAGILGTLKAFEIVGFRNQMLWKCIIVLQDNYIGKILKPFLSIHF